jgi:hypothetical protein
MDKQKDEYITMSSLKDRGWTVALIDKYLPMPCKTKRNPHYKSGPPMKCYSMNRVLAMEGLDEFKIDFERAKRRKQSAHIAILTKTNSLLHECNDVEFNVQVLNKKELIKLATQKFNKFRKAKYHKYEATMECDFYEIDEKHPEPELATPESDKIFLDRICVNYLRHKQEDYDNSLNKIKGKTGRKHGYAAVKTKVLDVIAEKYPYLKDECERQKTKMSTINLKSQKGN